GTLLITELSHYDQEWARESCCDLLLVFEPADLLVWAQEAGLVEGQSQYSGLRNGCQLQFRLFHLPPVHLLGRLLFLNKESTMSEYSIFTSESVSEGHPDKVADQISDAVLDAIIARDPYARVAVETLVKTGMAIVAGEVTTSCYVDLEDIVRKVITDIGYNSSFVGFDGQTCAVLNGIGKQS